MKQGTAMIIGQCWSQMDCKDADQVVTELWIRSVVSNASFDASLGRSRRTKGTLP